MLPSPFSISHFPIFLIFLLSCNSSKEPPTSTFPQEKVVSIMVDLHLAETASNLKLTEIDSTRPSYTQLCEAIFEKHNTTRAGFDSALYVMSFQPAEMNTVYDLVLERLSKLDAEVTAKEGSE